jgi:DNA adenine methylase
MRIIVPPIKSQGIKTKLVPWILEVAGEWKGKWIEPFVGTGVVVINARPEKAILNDINPHIINFYRAIQNKKITGAIVRKYLTIEGDKLKKSADNGYEYYKKVKDRFNLKYNPLDFLFLSRAGFNGMIRFNGKGKWNIPFCKKPERFSQSYITKITNQVKNCEEIIKPGWEFTCNPFEKVIEMAAKEDIIYCDPPYFGRYTDYYNNWTEQEEEKLFYSLSKTKARFILSTWHHNDYRKNTSIDKYWSYFNIATRDHFYHSGGKLKNRRSIVEALVYNFESGIQKHNHGIKTKQVQLPLFAN